MLSGMFDKCLYFNVVKLSRAVTAVWENGYRHLGLSPSQAYLMQFILKQPGDTPKSLAQKMDLQLSTVSRLVDGLGAKGLITKKKENTDKRESSIYPTDAGKKMGADLKRTTEALRKKVEGLVGRKKLSSVIPVLADLNDSIKSDLAGE